MVITTVTPEQVIEILVVETMATIAAVDQVKPAVDQVKIAEIVDIVTMDMVVVIDVMMNVDIKSTYEPDGPIRTN